MANKFCLMTIFVVAIAIQLIQANEELPDSINHNKPIETIEIIEPK